MTGGLVAVCLGRTGDTDRVASAGVVMNAGGRATVRLLIAEGVELALASCRRQASEQ